MPLDYDFFLSTFWVVQPKGRGFQIYLGNFDFELAVE